MNNRVAKKIRKQTNKDIRYASKLWWGQLMVDIKKMPFKNRWDLAYHILFKKL